MMHTHAQSSVSGPLPFLLNRPPALSLVLSFVMHYVDDLQKITCLLLVHSPTQRTAFNSSDCKTTEHGWMPPNRLCLSMN